MKNFTDIKLIDQLHQAIKEEKYTQPTAIQAKTIPHAVEGRDILGCAQTGTGKTAAFALPILHLLGKKNRKAVPGKPRVLVLAPTRELAIQIGDSFATYGRHLRLRHTLVYGGVGQGNQVRSLQRGTHILIATPGRLLDLMEQQYIQLRELETFVLDEADRMLDMGFLPDLKRIIKTLPKKRQSLFFSATLPDKVRELSEQLLTNPVSVSVAPKVTTVKKIDQRLYHVDRSGKMQLLRALLAGPSVERTIIFAKTKRGANALSEKLKRKGFSAAAIHGNKSQSARQKALEAFRRGKIRVLVATDVAARGIDIDGVSHVVNYDLPVEPECYVHRIGRTGRAGAEGTAISFCTPDDRSTLRAIEKFIGNRLPVAKDQPELAQTSDADMVERNNNEDSRRSKPAAKRKVVRRSGEKPVRKKKKRSNSKGTSRHADADSRKSRDSRSTSQSESSSQSKRKKSRRPGKKERMMARQKSTG